MMTILHPTRCIYIIGKIQIVKNLLLFIILYFFCLTISAQNWDQVGEDIISVSTDDKSGASVSLSDDGLTMAIGSPFNSDEGLHVGHVRIFAYNGVSWELKGNIIKGNLTEKGFGYSVSLSNDGNRVAICASWGKVRIYDWNGSLWQQIGNSLDIEPLSVFQGKVSISGNGEIVGVGDIGNSTNGTNAGEVRIYKLNGNTWQQKGSSITGSAYGITGYTLSLSNDGSCFATNHHQDKNIHVYYWNQADWVLKGDILNEFPAHHAGLSSDGNTLAVSGINGPGQTENNGYAQVYKWNGASWNPHGNAIEGDVHQGHLGYALSLSKNGKVLALGNHIHNAWIGETRVYVQNGANWEQRGETLYGQIMEFFAYSISLNASGNILGVGMPNHITNLSQGKKDKSRVFRNDAVLSVEETSQLDFALYPNPTIGNFTIDLGREYSDVSVNIYNILGQIISSETYASVKTIEKKITNMGGVYFVKISTANEESTILRIIKQ